ncbi:hypothetical protein [Phocaeicola sartorii]|nr:hypothetical protein [Phocaeicola sartorii]
MQLRRSSQEVSSAVTDGCADCCSWLHTKTEWQSHDYHSASSDLN